MAYFWQNPVASLNQNARPVKHRVATKRLRRIEAAVDRGDYEKALKELHLASKEPHTHRERQKFAVWRNIIGARTTPPKE